jgi:hypothetical protein
MVVSFCRFFLLAGWVVPRRVLMTCAWGVLPVGTIVLVIVSGFQAFGVDAQHHKAGIFTKIFVFLAFVSVFSSKVS